MQLLEFTKAIKELGDFYERKSEPKQGTIELWFDKVQSIPSEPVPWIVGRIEQDSESFPRNLPGALWAGFREWMQLNPDKAAHRENKQCVDCEGGLLWVRKYIDGRVHYAVFECAQCGGDVWPQYPSATRDELMADYDVMPKDGWPYEKPAWIKVVNRPADRSEDIEHINPVICRQQDEPSSVVERFRARMVDAGARGEG